MGIFSANTSYLGVDIGTSSIKMVELNKEAGQVRLVTYGFSEASEVKAKENWQNDPQRAAYVINKIWHEAGAKSRNAVSSLPAFSVFSSILNLSNTGDKDMAGAVHWEAKKVIPLPLDEMILDWKEIGAGQGGEKGGRNTKVLLTGAPKALVKKYIDIFKEARMGLLSLETETFSLIRSLVGPDRSAVVLVEMGAATTDITIVENGIPVLSRSLDFGGINITDALSRQLNIALPEAEQFKYDLGMSALDAPENALPDAIADAVNPVVNEIKFALNLFHSKNKARAEKIILTGGSALLANLSGYLGKLLDMKVILGDPWARVACPEELKSVLNEIGPRFSVAVGLALRQLV